MKKAILIIATSLMFLTSCERVAPNYYGVLMENFGKDKSDYSKVSGRINTWGAGTELFQVPAWEQRGEFSDGESKRVLHLKASDNTEFMACPLYSYKARPNMVVDLVFQNARLGSGENFIESLEDNVLEPHVYDLIKEESRKYSTDELMATGGSLKFEEKIQEIIRKAFESKGLELITFSANLDFSNKVKAKIDSRNEVNTNLSVIDQLIIEQRKKNELAVLRAEHDKIISSGLTDKLLRQQFIQKWDGKSAIYGEPPMLIQPIK